MDVTSKRDDRLPGSPPQPLGCVGSVFDLSSSIFVPDAEPESDP